MTLAIRLATSADLPAICTLGQDVSVLHASARPDVFAAPTGPAQHAMHWRHAIEGEGRVTFLAEEDAVAIGFVTGSLATEASDFFLPVRLCHVGTLGVIEAQRGRGVGRALMAQLEAWAAARGAGEVHLVVWRFNERARRLYAEIGYEERCLMMVRTLPP